MFAMVEAVLVELILQHFFFFFTAGIVALQKSLYCLTP